MTTPSSGRRANGLQSADWGALVDLDPRLSEPLLARLADAGVAAYVEPARAVDSVSRAVLLPSRPLDRLWVDPARAEAARTVVGAEVADLTALLAEQDPGANAAGLVQPVPHGAASRVLPPPVLPAPAPRVAEPPPDDDEMFRQIVAGFELTADPAASPWPAQEDLSSPPPSGPPSGPLRRRRSDRPAPPAEDALPSWVEPDAIEDEFHYEPPPPPPVPRLRPRTVGVLSALLLGLVLLFRPSLLGLYASGGVDLLGLLLVVGGAGGLVWWMRDASPDDPADPDDGAVV